jgi:acetoin utilization protein AcuB
MLEQYGERRKDGPRPTIEEALGMLVDDIMQRRVVTATPRTAMSEAMHLVRTRGIRHLVIVDDGALVGIISDRDFKQADALNAPSTPRSVDDIMTRVVITIEPTAPVEDAARVMLTEKISALPVTEAGRLVGIVTETDVMRLFVKALGAGEPSSRIDVVIGPSSSALADVVATVQAAGAPISSIVTLPGGGGLKDAVLRVGTIDPRPAIAALVGKGVAVKTAWRSAAPAERVA